MKALSHGLQKEYEKTVYTRYYPFWYKCLWPKNLVSGHPVKIFGKTIAFKLRLAKPNYKWSK